MKSRLNTINRTFPKTKASKILIWGFGAILFFFSVGFAGSSSSVLSSAYLDPQQGQKAVPFDQSDDFSVTPKVFAHEKQSLQEPEAPFYNEEISSETLLGSAEKSDQEMIDRAFSLCQRANKFWKTGDAEKAIETLDQAYSIILGIKLTDGSELVQQVEDMRFIISKRIYEIYASRKMNIEGINSEVPVTINEQVQHEIDLFTKGKLRPHFIESYKRSGKYRQMIVGMLAKEGLPEELSWLPLVESGFVVNALSNRRALGLWQFIPSTGYKFGLGRSEYIDERLDPEKATRAAIRYLKELHRHFGDWTTALAAYNCGENRVLRVIRDQKINYLDNFWDLYKELPQETANYVPKFLATIHIVNHLPKYGLENIALDTPLRFESVAVTRVIQLEDVAKMAGIETEILEALNPALRKGIVPGGNYMLKVPPDKKQMLYASIDNILRLNPNVIEFNQHRVRYGETLSLIANRYGTSVENLMIANHLYQADHIVSGKTIKIPHKIDSFKKQFSTREISEHKSADFGGI
jgi:membrane-bound lytic murein transglycosylase D